MKNGEIKDVRLCVDNECFQKSENAHYHLSVYIGAENANQAFSKLKQMTEKDFPGWILEKKNP